MTSPISPFTCSACSKIIEEGELACSENAEIVHKTCLTLMPQQINSPFVCTGCSLPFRAKELKRLNSQDDLVHEDCTIAKLFEIVTTLLATIQRTSSHEELI